MTETLTSPVFAGMTRTACAAGCGTGGCTITGSVCAHPCKGGLQTALRDKPQIAERFRDARRFLGLEEQVELS